MGCVRKSEKNARKSEMSEKKVRNVRKSEKSMSKSEIYQIKCENCEKSENVEKRKCRRWQHLKYTGLRPTVGHEHEQAHPTPQ